MAQANNFTEASQKALEGALSLAKDNQNVSSVLLRASLAPEY